jgi:hypothetical protein
MGSDLMYLQFSGPGGIPISPRARVASGRKCKVTTAFESRYCHALVPQHVPLEDVNLETAEKVWRVAQPRPTANEPGGM